MPEFDESKTHKLNKLVEATGIKHPGLLDALIARGHTGPEIAAMSAKERLDEFLGWEGIIGWTDMIITVAKAAGFVMGERIERGLSNDEQMQKFLEGVVGAVDADDYARHSLWEDYAEEALTFRPGCTRIRYSWKQHDGLLTCVGKVAGMEVWVSLMTATVGGHKLLFYYGSGTFVDHDLIETWLKVNLPETARFGPGGYNHTNATNFSNIFPMVPA